MRLDTNENTGSNILMKTHIKIRTFWFPILTSLSMLLHLQTHGEKKWSFCMKELSFIILCYSALGRITAKPLICFLWNWNIPILPKKQNCLSCEIERPISSENQTCFPRFTNYRSNCYPSVLEDRLPYI